MNTQSNAVTDSAIGSEGLAPAMQATRPLYWSVRREVWENRSIWLAPLIVAAFVLVGFGFSTIRMPERRRAVVLLDEARQRAAVGAPYDFAAGALLLTAFIVGIFYCADALHGERRDRSILFWKSLPVSDLNTVLSKAAIPLVVLPLFTFGVIVLTQLLMLALSTIVLVSDHATAAMLAPQLKYTMSPLALLYALVVISLWHAPLCGWMLLVSAWARRATLLWAIMPVFALAVFERIAFRTSHIASLLQYRVIGWLREGFIPIEQAVRVDPLASITPGKFLLSSGLWVGLVFAALFLAAAVRLRRSREPI